MILYAIWTRFTFQVKFLVTNQPLRFRLLCSRDVSLLSSFEFDVSLGETLLTKGAMEFRNIFGCWLQIWKCCVNRKSNVKLQGFHTSTFYLQISIVHL